MSFDPNPNRLLRGSLAIALLGATRPAHADTPSIPVEKPPFPAAIRPRVGHIEIRNFSRLYWSSSQGRFRSEGNSTLQYTPLPAPNEIASPIDTSSRLTANEVEFDAKSGQVLAKVGVLMKTPEGIFQGSKIDYNFGKKAGFLENASLETTLFIMKGEKIEAKANGSYVLTKGDFTTCDRTRSDYKVHASRLTVSPGKYVSAKNVVLSIGSTKLPPLPFYTQSLRAGSSGLPINYTYNRVEGAGVRIILSPLREPYRAFDVDLTLSLNGTPRGFLYYQQELNRTPGKTLPTFTQTSDLNEYNRSILDQLAPGIYQRSTQTRLNDDYSPRTTAYIALQNRQYSFTRLPIGSQLSRLPEIGLRFDNLLGHAPRQTPVPTGEGTQDASTSSALKKIPTAPFLLDANISLSNIYERPLNVASNRLGIRVQAATQPISLGKNAALRFGLSHWFSLYSATGTAYSLLSPEFDILYAPTNTSLFGIGYRYATDMGRTPFLFDRRDLRHEGRLRYQVGGAWGFGYMLRYDLENMRPFDNEFAVLRNFDCLQVGFVYRTFASQFGLVINYAPPSPRQIQERQESIQKKAPPLPPIPVPQPEREEGE